MVTKYRALLAVLVPISILAAVELPESALSQSAEQRAVLADQVSPILVGQITGPADQPPASAPQPAYQVAPPSIEEYFANWFNRVHAAQASRPNWMTPVVTVTPRLEQEFRYDQFWERLGTGAGLHVFDSGKGLELIPTETNELLLNLPPYQERVSTRPAYGWNDWPFLTIKQRLLSANEQNGNYILTAFLGFQAPLGAKAFTNNSWIITPTIAGGKGWGDFDIQMTAGFPIPTDNQNIVGTSAVWNTAFQYHLNEVFWPEFEVNYTHWFNGLREGKTQVFLTPGIIFGRFPLFDNKIRAIIGGAYQFAVTPKLTFAPVLTPVYNHAWILTARLAF
jgi:hypothetical protein